MTARAVAVVGFPRCGSSMLMRMLNAGGIMPVDGSQPRSYELAAGLLARVHYMPARILDGRAIKLLDYAKWHARDGLPQIEWRFIWSDRDPLEQARSNVKLLRATGQRVHTFQTGRFEESYKRDRDRMLAWYRKRGRVHMTSFERLLANPTKEARALGKFLPELNWQAAALIPQPRPPACAEGMAFERGEWP